MSYIGKEPQVGAYNMLDALTASATASYSLTLDSVAFVPESANHLICSLNGVIQKAGSSFTVSGSTLTFSSALTSSDSIDFILALGNVLDIGTPSDSTVTNAKTNFVSTSSAAGLQIKGDNTTAGTLQLNCEQNSHGVKLRSPAHSSGQSYTLTLPTGNVTADKFLKVASVSGSGTTGIGQLSFADAGGSAGTESFLAFLSSNQSVSDNVATLVGFDTESYDVGSNYTNSSTFKYTCPSAGKYRLYSQVSGATDGSYAINNTFIRLKKNGSTDICFNSSPTHQNSHAPDTAQAIIDITLDCSANDYFQIYASINSTGSGHSVTNIYSDSSRRTWFGGYKIA